MKNPTFWLTFIPAIISFVYTILSALGIVTPVSENELINIVTTVVTALTALGVFVDPTSRGVCDCKHCMELDNPET